MNFFQEWINYLGDAGVFFWLGAVGGLVVIFIVRMLLQLVGNRAMKTDRGEQLWRTIVNWITAFVVSIYLFTYLTESGWLFQTLFVLGNTNITAFLIVVVLFAAILAVKFSNAVKEYILPRVYDKYQLDRGTQATLNTLFQYIVVTVAVLFALSSLGFRLTSLTVFASVLGVGIGFGLQNIMNNFISGLIILFERPMSVGDRIIIDDTIADVEEIKMRATVVRTRANERIIIPNSYFLEEKFINRSYTDTRLRIQVEVGVSYNSDVDVVQELIKESVYELKAEKWDNIILDPAPRVFFEDFGDSSLDFKVWFWINDQRDEREFRIPSDLRFKIFNKFADNNIEIPFPQRDVHFFPNEGSKK